MQKKRKELSFKNNEFNETNRILEIMIATQRQAFYLSAAVPIFKKKLQGLSKKTFMLIKSLPSYFQPDHRKLNNID